MYRLPMALKVIVQTLIGMFLILFVTGVFVAVTTQEISSVYLMGAGFICLTIAGIITPFVRSSQESNPFSDYLGPLSPYNGNGLTVINNQLTEINQRLNRLESS